MTKLHSTTTADLDVKAIEIMDSRGRPTVQVTLGLLNSVGVGDVPAGASKGEDEAQTVPIKDALRNINEVIVPLLRHANLDLRNYGDLAKAERLIIEKAGDNFKDLGANACLPVSRALWQLAAALHGQRLVDAIRAAHPDLASERRVAFLMNIFNGGLHALKAGEELGRDRIDIQELMIVPVNAPSYAKALDMGDAIDAALKTILVSKFGEAMVSRADEAGFSVKGLGDSTTALGYVFAAIEKAGFVPGVDVKLALDVAASSFYDAASRRYRFRGKQLTSAELIDYLVHLVDSHPGAFLSIEDGLDENDWQHWPQLSEAMLARGVVTVGDDLFVTQLPRLRKGIAAKAAHAILIKVNQNGTVSGTLDVMKEARRAGMQCIVSHRSGETLDASIADLAAATGALGLKTGDPQPEVDFPDRTTWVRRAKYLRMVAIEEEHVSRG